MVISRTQLETLRDDFMRAFDRALIPLHRPISQFACEEIVIPSGPYKDQSFSFEFQPFVRLLFDLIEQGHFCRYAVTGTTQAGKSLNALVIPVMYHLFEIGEDVIVGIPQMEMAMEKWKKDFLPVIEKSRYADLLPDAGQGSKGGKFESITFLNGVTLKFMSAKGGDEKRSGSTARVLAMTEVDKYDQPSETSREGDPITQMIERLGSFETKNTVVYMECTCSIPTGRIWQEYTNGSAGRIATPCPHCHEHVTLERKDLTGWQESGNEIDAREWARFVCPECRQPWTEAQRAEANRKAKLVHRGQTISREGVITGPLPRTLTGGFRWNAANNLLKPAADIGGREWTAQFSPNAENTEKALCQFVWAMPWEGEISEGIDLDAKTVAHRLTGLPRYTLPADVETLVVHVDLHKRWHNWTVVGTSGDEVNRWYSVIVYGVTPTDWVEGTDNHVASMRKALIQVKETLDDMVFRTAPSPEYPNGVEWEIDLHLVDAGYEQDMALQCVMEFGKAWLLTKGHNPAENGYRPPRELTDDLVPGFHFHFSKQPAKPEIGVIRPWWLTIIDTDHWMRQVHAGFSTSTIMGERRQPRSIGLFGDDAQIHLQPAILKRQKSSFAEQILGWRWVSAFNPKKGEIQGWVPGDAQDHWLDNVYNCLAGDAVVRQLHARFKKPERKVAEPPRQFTTPDGRPYFIQER
jgi:hypothetical protein